MPGAELDGLRVRDDAKGEGVAGESAHGEYIRPAIPRPVAWVKR
jgi:hypothetical protein